MVSNWDSHTGDPGSIPTNVAIYMALVVAILYWSEGPVQQCVFVTDAYPRWLKNPLLYSC